MNESFIEKVRTGQIHGPTSQKFKLNTWLAEWDKAKEECTDEDQKIFKAGIVFSEMLKDIRHELKELFESKAPKIKSSKYLELLFSLSNRNTHLVKQLGKIPPDKIDTKKVISLLNITSSNNRAGVEFSTDEMVHSAVDGLEKAIEQATARINKKKDITAGKEPIETLHFIEMEAYFSQIYGTYESYWNALLWRDFDFIEHDFENKVYEIKQRATPSEIAYQTSNTRKLKILAHQAGILSGKKFLEAFEDSLYIKPCGSGKNKELKVEIVKKADQELQASNITLINSIMLLEDEFPSSLLEEGATHGFSINEVLKIYHMLTLLSLQYETKYPESSEVYSPAKLLQYCARVKKHQLEVALIAATGLSTDKVNAILNFLTYKGRSTDLWCHPLVETETGKYCLLTSALSNPVATRLVENWLSILKFEMTKKGYRYEETALEELNSALKENSLISNYDQAVTKKIKIDSEKEEVDIILRIGSKVLIGEAKSIVTTDSPISYYRSIKTLEYAADQAKKKLEFVRKNIEIIFKRLNWSGDHNSITEYIPFIVNSNKIYSGFSIKDVPVVDEKILSRYFKNGEFPVLSIPSDKGMRHIAWFQVYETAKELEDNIAKYLKTPPQILEIHKDFEYKLAQIPCLHENSYKVAYSRLMPKPFDIQIVLNKEHPFELKKIENINDYLSEVAVVV